MRVESNFKLKAKDISRYARRLSKKYLKGAMYASMENVANISVAEFMVAGEGGGGETIEEVIKRAAAMPTGKRLRVRTHRLASSILGTWRFSMAGLPKKVDRLVREKSPATHSEGTRESIREVKVIGSKIEGYIGSKVKYARIHEYGGTIEHRNLFGKGISASIKMPKRPYLEPAVKKAKPEILKIFEESIGSTWKMEKI